MTGSPCSAYSNAASIIVETDLAMPLRFVRERRFSPHDRRPIVTADRRA
jgi:hypothetical protein